MNRLIDIEIIKREEDRPIPYDLLYLADPSEEAVGDYLARGTCYLAKNGEKILGVSVLLPTRPLTLELINLAVEESCQRRGIGKQLIRHAIETARSEGYRALEVSTGNAGIGQLALYQQSGFKIFGVEKDYIAKYYPEPIVENGIECRDLVRLRMEL